MKKISTFIENGADVVHAEEYGVYPKSIHMVDGHIVFMGRTGDIDKLYAPVEIGFCGRVFTAGGCCWNECELDHSNAKRLRELVPYTAPSPVLREWSSVGVGDRLGIATEGHLRVFEKYNVYPVLAQQSIRELNLTERSFEQVLDCVSYAVFRCGFTKPFGADGDHLKSFDEVRYALDCGYTMITLDCSEHIRNDVINMSDDEVEAAYQANKTLEEKYLGTEFTVGNLRIHYSKNDFMRLCLIYSDAVDFAESVYKEFLADSEDKIDFEMSIDETATPTTPSQHFFVAKELSDRGVKVATIAPRFCGEFQKAIDYIGDLSQFETELAQHVQIANYFGYKLSIHSGSDKFSVFKLIGKYTAGHYHVKTAGTNWLEAMRIVAEHAPALYREIHQFALQEAFEKAIKYYHVTTDLNKIPPLCSLTDAQLPELFSNNDARQLIHITYGVILTEKNTDGTYRFKDRLYKVWEDFSEEYAEALLAHIGRHIEELSADIG